MSYDRDVSADGSVAKLREQFRWETNRNGGVTITEFLAKNLKSVVVPAQIDGRPVVAIGAGAFYGCSALTEITLPNGLQSIGDWAFGDCASLTRFNVSSGNAFFKAVDGVLFSADGKTLVLYPPGSNATLYVVPDGVETIAKRAFLNCDSLCEITLPNGGRHIGESAFNSCKSLKKITLPNGLQSVGDYAFNRCSALTEITLPNGLQSVGDYAFNRCSALTEITLPNGLRSVGDGAFNRCSTLKEITLPNGLQSVGDYAFYCCSTLKEITLPDGLQSVGDGAFGACYMLKRFNVSSGNAFFKTVDGVLFSADGKTLVAYPNGRKATEYVVPDGVETIAKRAFYRCSTLRETTLPNGLQCIGDEAFSGCDALSEITIPASVREISDSAFGRLEKTTFRGVEGSWAEECARAKWKEVKRYYFKTLNGRLLVPSKRDYYRYLTSYLRREADLGEGTAERPEARMARTALTFALTTLALPLAALGLLCRVCAFATFALFPMRGLEWSDVDGGVEISAFKSLRSSVVIPAELDGKPVVAVGDGAFEDCDALKSVTLPDGLQTIGDSAFENCDLLTEVALPDGLQTIGDSAFENCDSLTEVALPDGLQTIGDKAFFDCDSLESVWLPSSVKKMGEATFDDCWKLTLYIEDSFYATMYALINGICFQRSVKRDD